MNIKSIICQAVHLSLGLPSLKTLWAQTETPNKNGFYSRCLCVHANTREILPKKFCLDHIRKLSSRCPIIKAEDCVSQFQFSATDQIHFLSANCSEC